MTAAMVGSGDAPNTTARHERDAAVSVTAASMLRQILVVRRTRGYFSAQRSMRSHRKASSGADAGPVHTTMTGAPQASAWSRPARNAVSADAVPTMPTGIGA
jgi:hypothetical protein